MAFVLARIGYIYAVFGKHNLKMIEYPEESKRITYEANNELRSLVNANDIRIAYMLDILG